MKTRRLPDARAGFSLVTALAVGAAILVAAACGLVMALALTKGGPPPAPAAGRAPQEGEAGPASAYEFVDFGSAVVNLAEGRLTRYLKVNISLQVKKESAAQVRQCVTEDKKAIFMDWLVTYLSDKQLDEVKGAPNINRLRREVQDGFNAILAEQGDHKVEAVLFQEFYIQ